jgi:hypothetical protein
LTSNVSNDDGVLWICGSQIILDNKEYWELISDKDGTIKKGDSKIIDISFLTKGKYWVYTKTSTKPFIKN